MTSAPARTDARVLVVRAGSAALAVASLIALVAGGITAAPSTADAAGAEASPLTVRWAADDGAAAEYQPDRATTSPHFSEFDDLEITVSQTQNLGDQAVRISITGMAPTRARQDGAGQQWSTAQNFMQAMQCWGDPAAENFRETCQWGARKIPNNGLGSTVYRDNIYRVSSLDIAPGSTGDIRDVPFVTPGGSKVTGREVAVAGTDEPAYPLLNLLSAAATNEVQGARISAGETSTFDFEVQSSNQAPQLGCGDDGRLRCWLVLVPRGSVYGGTDDRCSAIFDDEGLPYEYGRRDSIQAGSPLNPHCDYWDNRIVVPLDFLPTGFNCPSGAAERPVVGSQLLVSAMSSWQPYLCDEVETTYTFSTNPDSIARLQLLEGDADLAFGSFPITDAELDDQVDPGLLDRTDIAYAPVGIGAVTVSFVADGLGGRIEDLVLSPRLLAKLLTQSYGFTVPRSSAQPADNIAHLGAVNRSYEYLRQDPDFQALNPNADQFLSNPAILLPGPSGADAIRQLWRWIVADDEARAWLSGEPDEWGMTINPYYLPKGFAKGDLVAAVPQYDEQGIRVVDAAGRPVLKKVGLGNPDGTPMLIAEAQLDRFLKVDESEVPIKLTAEKSRYGTLQAFPYVESFLAAARDAFRADPHARVVWDPTRLNSAGEAGDWVSAGPQVPGQRFIIAITDWASSERYALSTAGLRVADGTIVSTPSAESLASSLDALTATDVAAVDQIDPAKVSTGYPLTTVVYAAVNLTTTDVAARGDYADLIREVTTRGQESGSGVGDLPPGYLPLTSDLANQAGAAATAIESYIAPTPTLPTQNVAQDEWEQSGGGDDAAPDDQAESDGEITPGADAEAGRTPEAAIEPIGRAAFGASLVVGLAGAVFAPLLFRGRLLP